MISLADQPYVVDIDETEAIDGGDILLLGVSGPENPHGLILASRVLEWVPLDKIHVHTALVTYEPVEEPSKDDET